MGEVLHILCPNCDATNRIAAARLRENPKCGQCHRALFTGYPFELTTALFRRHVGRSDIPLVIDFWAPWCGPCKTMAPSFAEAANSLEPTVRLAKVNTDMEQSLATELNIRSIPTLVLFKGGHEVARQSGAMGASDIVRWVQTHA